MMWWAHFSGVKYSCDIKHKKNYQELSPVVTHLVKGTLYTVLSFWKLYLSLTTEFIGQTHIINSFPL